MRIVIISKMLERIADPELKDLVDLIRRERMAGYQENVIITEA